MTVAALRAARRAAGKCWHCKEPAAPGKSMCDGHLARERARSARLERKQLRTEKRRAAGARPVTCGNCGGEGHNRRGCAEL